MAHIHTGFGEHDHTASAFIVRTDFEKPKLLLHMHKKLHVLLQPGGHIELNENPWQAISHEIVEETGYELSQLRLLQPKIRLPYVTNATTHPYPVIHNTHDFDSEGMHKHTDVSYAFITNQAPAHQPMESESTDLRWLSLTELEALEQTEIFESVREIGHFVLEAIIREWEVVSTDEFA